MKNITGKIRFCSRCGADLEDFSSMERGTGPVCAKKDNVLYARAIPARYNIAYGLALGVDTNDFLYEPALYQKMEEVKELIADAAAKAGKCNEAGSMVKIGVDAREIVKNIDWMLSHRMNRENFNTMVKIVRALGYVELAAVLSQEASTTEAKVWIEGTSIKLLGKANKSGFFAMRKIPGIFCPNRGSDLPYSASVLHAQQFIENVRNFWPLYDANLEELLEKAKEISQGMNVSSPEEIKKVENCNVASLGLAGNGFFTLTFPWRKDKSNEMYALIQNIKNGVPYTHREYNPTQKCWTIHQKYLENVKNLLSSLFEVEVK